MQNAPPFLSFTHPALSDLSAQIYFLAGPQLLIRI
jgi:hypothetical protein